MSDSGKVGVNHLGTISSAPAPSLSLFRSSPDRDPRLFRYMWLLVSLAVTLAVGELIGRLGFMAPPSRFVKEIFLEGDPFVAAATGGGFLIFLAAGQKRAELVTAVLVGLALTVGFVVVRGAHERLLPIIAADCVGDGFGLAAMAVLARAIVRSAPSDARDRQLATLLAMIILPTFVVSTAPFLELTVRLHPYTYDQVVYAVDGTLGGQPGFAVGRIFDAAPLLEHAADLVYISFPAGFAFLYAVGQRGPIDRRHADPLVTLVAASVCGSLVYHALPVIGPIFTFHAQFPHAPPAALADVGPMAAATDAYRNCFPSLHTTWALLLIWLARHHRARVRVPIAIFSTLTIAATLGSGWHYLTDLVVAVPFAYAVFSACTPAARETRALRHQAIVFGAVSLSTWCVLLRWFPHVLIGHHAITWTLVAVCGLVPAGFQVRLALIERRLAGLPRRRVTNAPVAA
jgi:hypothetical protein